MYKSWLKEIAFRLRFRRKMKNLSMNTKEGPFPTNLMLKVKKNAGVSTEEDGDKNKAIEPEVDQKQVERNVQKMKENGIVDQNGKPAPGVDLNDYPGLG